MTQPDYEYATNLAYEELMQYDGVFPKIDVFDLLSRYSNISLKTYTQSAEFLGCSHNEFAYHIAPSEHSFIIPNLKTEKYTIFFNNLKSETTIRFNLMHELGHIRLGHLIDDEVADKEANCFARNILCPVLIIDEYNLSTVGDYVECFDISKKMAQVALEHYSSDNYYIRKELYQKLGDKIYCNICDCTMSELY